MYYTPEVEDMYLGYKYEQCHNDYEDIWTKEIVTRDWSPQDAEISIDHGGLIRTKYLDREDIESLGWILVAEELKQYSHWCNFESKDWELSVQLNDKYFPRHLNLSGRKHCSWKGNIKIDCKSINELKILMKWLDIK